MRGNLCISPFRLFTFSIFTKTPRFHDFTFSRFHFLRKHHDFTFSPFHFFTASISWNDVFAFNLAPPPSREPWACYCPQSRWDATVRPYAKPMGMLLAIDSCPQPRIDATVRPDGAARGETKLAWTIPSRDRGRQSQTPPENDGTKWLSGKLGYKERDCG